MHLHHHPFRMLVDAAYGAIPRVEGSTRSATRVLALEQVDETEFDIPLTGPRATIRMLHHQNRNLLICFKSGKEIHELVASPAWTRSWLNPLPREEKPLQYLAERQMDGWVLQPAVGKWLCVKEADVSDQP